jgi:adenosylcobinamide-GDP ribazoletransferase
LVVATAAVLTRALHLDGLADSADGLASMRDREGVLEVMRDPHVGAFGATALVIVVLVQAACVAEMPEGGRLAGLVSAALASRATMAVACAVFPYARREGKGGGVVGKVGLAGAAVACASAAALAWGADWVATGDLYRTGALATLGVGSAAGLVVSALMAARLRGATGDTVGASGEIAATASLVWAVGAWA